MRKICGISFSNDCDIAEHIMEMKILFEKLETLGEQFSERWLVAMLLSSLPSSFVTLGHCFGSSEDGRIGDESCRD